MIMKILILGAVLYAVYFIFFKKPNMLKDKYKNSDTVVECEECGVYTDVKEMFVKDGKQYCSKECARLK
jgi:uncharacterized protein